MLVPVIHFNGCCADAIALYEKAFTVTDKHVDYYRDAPDNSGMDVSESTQNLIMHSRLAINGTYINMSDDMSDGFVPQHPIFNIFLSSADEVEKAYDILKANGTVAVNIGPQFFSPLYCAVTDRFGVRWQVMVSADAS